MNLESGKWYKIQLYKDTYFKLIDITPRISYNQLNCSDRIWQGAYVKDTTISHTEAEKSAILLEDLRELEPYLPEGHPDKKFVLNQQEEDYGYLTKILEKWNIK